MTVPAEPSAAPDLSIRARPPSPKRLSRKVLLAGVCGLAALVVLALAMGLNVTPRSGRQAQAPASANASPPETIAGAPLHYDAGAFAGDSETQELELAPPSDAAWIGQAPAEAPAPSRPTEDPEALARAAPIGFSLEGEGDRGSRPSAARTAERHGAFLSAQGASDARLDAVLLPPRSQFELMAGSVIAAALTTELNSDLPGRVIAQVTAPVYDSITGRHLLIPQGARLIGAYDSDVAYGERRLLVVWNRLILPNGWSIDLEGMGATDPAGAAGLTDRTDNHLGRLATAIGLAAIVSVVADRAEGDDDESLTQSVGDAAAQEAARAGGRIIDRDLEVRPALRVRAGAPVRVLIMRDIRLRPYG